MPPAVAWVMSAGCIVSSTRGIVASRPLVFFSPSECVSSYTQYVLYRTTVTVLQICLTAPLHLIWLSLCPTTYQFLIIIASLDGGVLKIQFGSFGFATICTSTALLLVKRFTRTGSFV
ncbi:hypothetical protein EDB89DRAFT_1972119 [Lactarius sanguifluus]|nr:hypothetical protein EDB89DRAFT_1972119 [Lactarius sanguifluus]